MDGFGEKPRSLGLLDLFAEIVDDRESWRVAHPFPEVLLLVVCGVIASCDDFEDIADRDEAHLDFLLSMAPEKPAIGRRKMQPVAVA